MLLVLPMRPKVLLVVAVTVPFTVWFAVNVFAPRVAKGEQVNGSALNALPDAQALDARLSVTGPLLPPPVRPVPAVTLVIVPAPGNACPVAKVIWPLLAMFNPVSEGEPEPPP